MFPQPTTGNIRPSTVRRVLRDIGYDKLDMEIDWETCEVLNGLEVYRPQPYKAANLTEPLELHSAGDQGLMFGYATDETPSLLLILSPRFNRAGTRESCLLENSLVLLVARSLSIRTADGGVMVVEPSPERTSDG
jgi:hypothetical protein